jgi:hypothetical protein
MEYRIVKAYSCAVTLIDGHLHLCRLLKSGELQMHKSGPNWIKVRPPISQHFLDAANAVLGSAFVEADFRLDKLNLTNETRPRRPAKVLAP